MIKTMPGNVRFVPKAEITRCSTTQRILSAANSGGPNDAERFRASQLDYQFELGDKLDGQLPDLVPLGSTQQNVAETLLASRHRRMMSWDNGSLINSGGYDDALRIIARRGAA